MSSKRSWFKLCGVVLQDGFIFSGNFTENIALGDASPDMERVEYAAKTENPDSKSNL